MISWVYYTRRLQLLSFTKYPYLVPTLAISTLERPHEGGVREAFPPADTWLYMCAQWTKAHAALQIYAVSKKVSSPD